MSDATNTQHVHGDGTYQWPEAEMRRRRAVFFWAAINEIGYLMRSDDLAQPGSQDPCFDSHEIAHGESVTACGDLNTAVCARSAAGPLVTASTAPPGRSC